MRATRSRGPAVIREPLSTTFMLPGQVLRVGEYGELSIGGRIEERDDRCRDRHDEPSTPHAHATAISRQPLRRRPLHRDSVLSSRMRYVVQHMSAGLLDNAFSLILRDWYDFAATSPGPPDDGTIR